MLSIILIDKIQLVIAKCFLNTIKILSYYVCQH